MHIICVLITTYSTVYSREDCVVAQHSLQQLCQFTTVMEIDVGYTVG